MRMSHTIFRKMENGHGQSLKSIVRNLQLMQMEMEKQISMHWQVSLNIICQCVRQITTQHLWMLTKKENMRIRVERKNSSRL